MINTVSDLLEEIRDYALSRIINEEGNIEHAPTIGNIFEGLTTELLNNGIFVGLDLKIVQKSFIYNDSKELSEEIDCMLVVGDGSKILFTDQYKYHIKDVIAVIQVKKNLYKNDIYDAHHNLLSVTKVSEPRDAEQFVWRLHRDAFRGLVSKELPTLEEEKKLSERENLIFHLLRMEAFHPLRIVIGYYGYTTEYGLREGFVKKMEEVSKNGPVHGYGPVSFPNLLICGDHAIIKLNGMPMGIPFNYKDDFYWNIFVSTSGKPMRHLLELIWTRLTYKYSISSNIFGDNNEIETAHPFLSCKETKLENGWGWEYYYHKRTKKELEEPLISKPWSPKKIDRSEFIILNALIRKVKIDIVNDKAFLKWVKDENIDLEKVLFKLIDERLIYISDDKIGLLVDQLVIVESGGEFYAGENNNGEMSNYFLPTSK